MTPDEISIIPWNLFLNVCILLFKRLVFTDLNKVIISKPDLNKSKTNQTHTHPRKQHQQTPTIEY